MGVTGCNTTINSGVPNSVIDDFNGNNTFDVADFKPIESGQLGRLIRQRFGSPDQYRRAPDSDRSRYGGGDSGRGLERTPSG
jgi:hypothetical protein